MNGVVSGPLGMTAGWPARYLAPAVASLLLSAWILYLDPAVGDAGAAVLHAARLFSEGQWRAGAGASSETFHALLVALASGAAGGSVLHAAQGLNALFHVLLATGFVAVAMALDDRRWVPAVAALLVLSLPALNGFRPDVTGDAARWAFYLWSFAGFMHWQTRGDSACRAVWLSAGVLSALFGLEMLLFLLIAPAWQWTRSSAGSRWPRRLAVAAVAVAAVAACAAWREAWLAGPPVDPWRSPVAAFEAGWRDLVQGLQFTMTGLRIEFLDEYSRSYTGVALVASLVTLSLAGMLKALGPVHALGAAVAVAGARRIPAPARPAWGIYALTSVLILGIPALVALEVTPRDAMPAVLVLLAGAPAVVSRSWAGWGPGLRRWVPPVAGVLLLVTGYSGLSAHPPGDVERRAGIWLSAQAPPDATLFSNSRVLVWYSGLDGFRPGGDYTWQEGMAAVWQDRWRNYEYLALVIAAGEGHREDRLLKRIGVSPLKRFSGDDGTRVLIFRPAG